MDFYSGYRLHRKLGMKTPDQFEAEYFPAAKINKNKRLPLLKPELPDSKAGTFQHILTR